MSTSSRNRRLARTIAFAAGVGLAACGGGSSSFTPAFSVQAISVSNNQVLQINRPIELKFNFDVDFDTVNLNTINIARPGGAPATGEFVLVDARTVQFLPACPREADYSDAGLLPGGLQYTITIVGSSTGVATVQSTSGQSILNSKSVTFLTPNSTDPSLVFVDARVGPPAPVIRANSTDLNATYLELGGDGSVANRVYLEPRDPPNPSLGAKPPTSFVAPLNLYSASASKVAIVLYVNQPVDPATSNATPDNIKLEYESAPNVWTRVPHTVSLVANCTETGAVLRIEPTGILPQGRTVRVAIATPFKDLVGDTNSIAIVVGAFVVDIAQDPPGGAMTGEGADEYLEEFLVSGDEPGSLEDTSTVLVNPNAVWSADGALKAGFQFSGTGGPGGNFDWVVNNDFILDTNFAVIPNSTGTATQAIVNGIIDVRNFTVTDTGKLIIQGPNTCTLLASGLVTINGTIIIDGTESKGVNSFDTTNIPELGGSGQAGGGRGGTGSILTNQSTPAGETGDGPFAVPGFGGGGGETGYAHTIPPPPAPGEPPSDCQQPSNRRGGGGGGGSLGAITLLPGTNTAGCPDQSKIGLDAEDGFLGAKCANSAVRGVGIQPQGGKKGPRPFFDNDSTNLVTILNDFWGTMLTAPSAVPPMPQTLIQGELTKLWAGAGGGGGGNAVDSDTFPLTPFSVTGDEKGAGGGGGAGGFAILALGNIVFGAKGQIHANGGPGGGGENTNFLNRIGSGSGGGSGGHIVLQTASKINFSAAKSTLGAGIFALGGQGGAGASDAGGARSGGIQTATNADALPPNSYPTVFPNAAGLPIAPCAVAGNIMGDAFTINQGVGNVIPGCGGDGGPGIIQLHVPSLSDIVLPTGTENLFKLIKPPPVGSTPNNVNTPMSGVNPVWNQLLPVFGRKSTGQSKWIALGSASVNPTASAPDQVKFSFGGTNTAGMNAGKVITTGSGTSAETMELAAITTGTISNAPTRPYIVEDRTIVLDASGLSVANDIYKRNANLLRRFALKLTHASVTTTFEVGSATYDASLDELRVTVTASGTPLDAFDVGDAVALHPRFFLVKTGGIDQSLPSSSSILIEFQAAPENSLGAPNEAAASAWTADIATLSANPNFPVVYKFIRFRVNFDIRTDGQPLTFDTPIPTIDFFRVPFKF